MYRDSRSPPQPRSFSFSKWDSREMNNADNKLYYNYNNKQQKIRNQYRGDIPSFGDSKGYQSKGKYNNDQYSFELQRKIKPEYQLRTNYSMERRESNRAQSYGSKKAWQQNSFQIGRSYDKVGQGSYNKSVSRMEFEKATEQKLSNIDRINEKIKKILNTLNEEQKKISHHHLKIGHKKSNKYGYAHRIKTEGDDYRYQQNQYENSITYDRFLGAANGFANQQQFYSSSDLFKQLDMESNYDKFSNKQFVQGTTFQKTNGPLETWNKQINVEFAQKDRTLSQIKDYQSSMNKQKKRADGIDNSYKLLKGTNVKSTDSLNLSMSICCKNQKQNEIGTSFKQGSRDQSKYYTKEKTLNLTNKSGNHRQMEDKINQPPQITYSYSFSTQQDSKKEYKSIYEPTKTQNNFNQLRQYENKSKPLFNQSQKKQTPQFNSSEDMKRIDRTPTKSKLEKSLSKYDRSEKSCKLSNGKNLDEEIQKIQKKIQDCQQIKKSLNLEDGDGCRKSRIQLNKSLNKYKDRFSHSKGKQSKSFESTEKQLKVNIRQNLVAQFKTDNQQLNKIKEIQNNFVSNGRQNVEVEISLPKPFKMCSRKNTKRTEMCSEVKQIQSAFISQDRSELSKQPMRQLIQLICTQIDLDTNFRNSKKWFNRKVNLSKWKQLDRQLQNKNILTNEEQNKKIFTLTQEEDNPFYTERDDQGSYAELIRNFIDSQKHWLDKIQKKFACEEIGQHIQQMDIYGRGIITIEDLVRYINLQSDKYYRNRDLSLIYKRLAGHSEKATVDNILSQLCHL